MNRLLFLLIVLVGLSTTTFSQNTNLNDYSYIIVPTKFDFLHGEDQFKINSMTKFYLSKYGFNAMFNTEAPDNVLRCDGLWADVIKTSGLVYTKLEVVIKDCKDNELYRSQQGRSKFKEFQKAYQDALRKAFVSFKSLNVNQPDMVVPIEVGTNDKPVIKEVENKTINEVSVNEVAVVSEAKNSSGILPQASYSTYYNNDSNYLLRKNNNDYTFYKESNKGDFHLIGTISMNNNALIYREKSGNTYDVTIDKLGNISIYIDGKANVYRKMDQ